ncbi:MAG TPA: dihydroxy-acid dehydratase [Spirochaetota bacterium]|nr:dihydroxy-acid dehydratase [Spirochaetota bacterium]
MAKKSRSDVIFDDRDFPISVVRKAFFRGLGMDPDDLKDKPLIAIASSRTEINPGHVNLDTVAARVKEGVYAAGGVPFEFNVPAPCDGMTEGHDGMRYVLAQRDLIADIIETHIRSMRYDAVVFIASCDKIIPGMIMAAARLDLPSIFVTGGPGCWQIRYSPSMNGSVDHKSYTNPFDKIHTSTPATCGACELMGTANTMQCLVEAMGLCLPGTANIPAVHTDKLIFARRAGMRIVAMSQEGLSARMILTRDALDNALMADLAIGGSTNTALHLPAIAHELGIDYPIDRFNDFNRKIPTLCAISPSGPYGIVDLYIAGGMPAVMKVLENDLNTGSMTVTGKTVKENLLFAVIRDEKVIPPRDRPHLPEGGTVILKGSLAPEGAVVKQSAVHPDMKVFSGPARVFDSEADALRAIREKRLNEGEVVVIRYEGPIGGPGMPETLAVTMGIELAGFKKVALITDGRFSGASAGPCIGHVSPEAAAGGPIALVRDGDIIRISIPGRSLELDVPADELARRRSDWKPVVLDIPPGYMKRYVKHVGSAAKGAVLE